MKKLFVFASAVLMAAAVNADVTINMADYTMNGDPDYVEVAEADGIVTVTYDLGAWQAAGVEYDVTGKDFNGIDVKAKLDGTCEEGQWLAFMVYLTDEDGVRFFNPGPDMHLNDARFADFYSVETYASDEAGVPTLYFPTEEMWPGETPVPFSAHKAWVNVGIIANPMLAEQNTFSIKELVLRQAGTGLSEVAAKAEAKKVMKDGKLFIQVNGREFTAAGMAL